MWEQLNESYALVAAIIANDTQAFANGFHVIAHSQGGLLMRCLLQQWRVPYPVMNFVTLAGLHNGFYGDHNHSGVFGMNDTISEITDVLYTHLLQDSFSLANWWHSPMPSDDYLHRNIYLPAFNDPSPTDGVRMKANFLSNVHNLTMLGSPDDGTLEPWSTSLLGFYDQNMHLYNYTQTNAYANNTFGLKNLDESGGLSIIPQAGIEHEKHTGAHARHHHTSGGLA
eukprot:TRINITY_DN2504_c0_g1_i1.p2 TRINITY_DN2504_c0_g1~~TRINITY_DN2504_c0_g1_i1.p2  ORF type:complete len:226 (-),score=26.51 TRINITY_DN2504_c0_g1_i1:120-797(-)